MLALLNISAMPLLIRLARCLLLLFLGFPFFADFFKFCKNTKLAEVDVCFKYDAKIQSHGLIVVSLPYQWMHHQNGAALN